jgi:hypothetical protein
MPRFTVRITGEDLDGAKAALEGAGILETKDAGAGYVPEMKLSALSAVLDADTAEDAEARVRDVLPEGDYDVERAEPA